MKKPAKPPKPAAKAPRPEWPKTFDCEQGSDEWFALRLGLPTASEFATIMATGADGTSNGSLTRTKLLHRLAGEVITGEVSPAYRNAAMDRGNAMEPLAREAYAKHRGVEVDRIGFIRNELAGASPDGLVGFNGGVEFKTAQPDVLIPILMKGAAGFPSQHRAQVQGNMWICDREWWDLSIFWPRMPPCIFRIERDDRYIREISNQVEIFRFDLDNLVTRLRKMGAS